MESLFLVPFRARALAEPRILWTADGLPRVPALEDVAATTLAEGHGDAGDRTLHAERYGGSGLGRHGGGARAAVVGEWLVKGVGPTPLCDPEAPFWNAHGMLTLADALAEAAWSQALDIALPHGVAKAAMVVETGASSPWRDPRGQAVSLRGGLLVRQACHRLGSFERALHYAAKPALEGLHPDAIRVRDAVRLLPALVGAKAATPDAVAAALGGIVDRHAAQTAAACAKRLMHGALTGSNVALDGRWLDLGSVTQLEGFGIAPMFQPSFWREYRRIQRSIENICFFLGKYSRCFDFGGAQRPARELVERHEQMHEHELAARMVARAGFPLDVVRAVPPTVRESFGRMLVALAQAGTSVDAPAGSAQHIGRYRFGRIVRLAAAREPDSARLEQELPEPGVRRPLLRAHAACLDEFSTRAASGAAHPLAVHRLHYLVAAKADLEPGILARPHFDERAREATAQVDPALRRQTASTLAQALVDRARVALEEPADLCCTVWQDAGLTIEYDARRDRWRQTSGGSRVLHPWSRVLGSDEPDFPASAIRRLHGERELLQFE